MRQLFFMSVAVLIFSSYGHASLESQLLSSNSQKQESAFQKFQKLDDESKENCARNMIERLKDNAKTIDYYSSYRGVPGEAETKEEAESTEPRIINALKTMRKAAVRPLMDELENPSSEVTSRIIEILGAIGEDAAPTIPQLKKYLQNGNPYANYTAQALANIGPTAIPALLEYNDGYGVATDALKSMGATAIPELIKYLPNPKAIEVLGEFGPTAKDAIPALKNLLNNESLYQSTHDAIEKIDPTVFKEEKQEMIIQQAKEQKEKRRKHLIWEKYSQKLLVGGKLKIPDNKTLLRMAGYKDNAQIKIIASTLFLQNHLGYPTLDSYYFIFTAKHNHVEKILTILFNRGEDENQATNLLAYAPMMSYFRVEKKKPVSSTPSSPAQSHLAVSGFQDEMDRAGDLTDFAHYVPKEFLTPEVKEEYVVYPHKASYYIFNYGEKYKANESAFRGNLDYSDVCNLIFKETNDLYGMGRARMRVGEGGKFHLTDFRLIYPRQR